MPQLAPVNWLLLFFIFWFVVALSSTLIWWSSKTDYVIQGTTPEAQSPPSLSQEPHTQLWNW